MHFEPSSDYRSKVLDAAIAAGKTVYDRGRRQARLLVVHRLTCPPHHASWSPPCLMP